MSGSSLETGKAVKGSCCNPLKILQGLGFKPGQLRGVKVIVLESYLSGGNNGL